MCEKIVNCDIIYNFAIIIELEGEKIEGGFNVQMHYTAKL